MINEDKEMQSKRYQFTLFSRRNYKNKYQADIFLQELHKHGRLYVFNEKDLNKYIEHIKEQERKDLCDLIEAQMATEVFCDEEFTSKQFENAIRKVRNGGPFKRAWQPKMILIEEKDKKEIINGYKPND